jgi:elongation factor Ts
MSMPTFTAKDVQSLRQATGVGMLDAKRALEECGGDPEQATRWLREKGLADKAKREDREASQGAVAVVRDDSSAAIAELRCETDFVAKSADFVALADEMAALVAAKGEAAVAELQDRVDQLTTSLKENISVGRVVRLQAGPGEVVDTYLHQQAGRGVNAVAVVVRGGSASLAHDIAVHIAFARPSYLRREDVPEADVAAERETVEAISRNEGKPEAALPKIVEGRMNGWFRERVLLEQPYVRDEKQTVAATLGNAEIVRYAQVVVGS